MARRVFHHIAIACLLLATAEFVPVRAAGRILCLYRAKADWLVVHAEATPSVWSNQTINTDLTTPVNYTVSSVADAAFTGGKQPLRIGRKYKGLHGNATSQTVFTNSSEVWIALQLPSAVKNGSGYTISFAPAIKGVFGTPETTCVFDDKTTYSEAIHVNSVGYSTNVGRHYAYVSQWLGDAGGMTYADGTPFHLVNVSSSQFVFNGILRKNTGDISNIKTGVWECDFSTFSTPGIYRVVVDGIGCSFPFEIHKDAYRTAFQVTCRGLFHQRCAQEFTAQYTKWVRPRCHHSDDIPAFQSTSDFVNDNPQALAAKATTERINCWGGWHDAGDFDHYESHLKIPFMLFAAYELNPASFSDGELNIPGSGNGIPDILDEARWGVDLWKRLQKADGGVPSYSTPFPSPSSLWSCTAIYASVPTPGATQLYAGMAAAMGYYLKKFGKTAEGDDYINSAKKSYAYAGGGSEKAMAALWLWRATGDASYHNTFKNLNPGFAGGADDIRAYIAACYVTAPGADAGIVGSLRTAIVNDANGRVNAINGNAMRWTSPLSWLGGLTTPQSVSLPITYFLTADAKYRDALALECDFLLGGNPLNMTWVTGLGARYPTDPLLLLHSQYFAPKGLPAMPGIVPYGPAPDNGDPFCAGVPAALKACYPSGSQWSLHELWFENPLLICTNEFTVHQTIGPAVFMYAALVDTTVSRNATGLRGPAVSSSHRAPAIHGLRKTVLAMRSAPAANAVLYDLHGGNCMLSGPRPVSAGLRIAVLRPIRKD